MSEKSKIELSREEQVVVYSFINEKVGFWRELSHIWPYFLPLMLLALYGLIIFDPIITLGSVVSSFIAIIWYVTRSSSATKDLQSALKKIDDEIDLY